MAGPGPALSSVASAGLPGEDATAPEVDACRLAAELIERHGMLAPGGHVLAAFSGGADSTALAILLKDLGYRVTLAHVDHAMRADSALDVFHCRSTARRLGLSIEVMRVRVEPPTEAEARRVRYEALEQMRLRVGAERVATGHTMNDEAETVKMRLERGGFGLGIPPVRGSIVRPLLCIGRRSTESVCRDAGVLFLEDPSNSDTRFTRNRIRKDLAKGKEGEIERLVSVGAENRSSKNALDALVSAHSDLLRTGSEQRLDRRRLLNVPEAVARGLVRRALRAAGVDASVRHVDDVLMKVAASPGCSLDLPGGLAVWSESHSGHASTRADLLEPEDWLVIGRRPERKEVILSEVSLEVPGLTTLPEWGLRVAVSLEGPPGLREVIPARGTKRDVDEELFDAEALPSGPALRQWRPGDRFRPLRREGVRAIPAARGRGSKKLQDFFVDSKVPRAERARVPLVAAGDEIVWVVGHRIDDRYKVTTETRTAARIRVGPLKSDL